MASGQQGSTQLPKFGEWDVNNPSSAEGFTVIFNKARDEKKTIGTAATQTPPRGNEVGAKPDPMNQSPRKSATQRSIVNQLNRQCQSSWLS